jgi:hypothetical protein
MQHYLNRDGLKLAYYVDDFTKPWIKPQTVFLLHAAMGNAQRWFSWVPELAKTHPSQFLEAPKDGCPIAADYPLPCVDHKTERDRTLAIFKKHRANKP